MNSLELTPRSFRKARTRTLIQLGGLIEKSGLLQEFGLVIGADLQKDIDMREPIAQLMGALLDLTERVQQNIDSRTFWEEKGKLALKIKRMEERSVLKINGQDQEEE